MTKFKINVKLTSSFSVGFIAFVCYSITLRREIEWGDSAELALQAWQLGVAHPPGFPVHTILGKFLMLFFHDPAIATNMLSALASAAAVSIVYLLLFHLTHHSLSAICGSFVFAFCPIIWEMAVFTEVYNINIFFLVTAVYLILTGLESQNRKRLIGGAVFYGLSLGAYLANLLLLPAFLFWLWKSPSRRKGLIGQFLLISLTIGTAIMSWSIFRTLVHPPIGTLYIPHTPLKVLYYFAGIQYGSISVHPMSFYWNRLMEHAILFSYNFRYVGILLAFMGFFFLWQNKRLEFWGFLFIFAINFFYFTQYGVRDYYTKVQASYLVFSIAISYALASFDAMRNFFLRWVPITLCMLLIAAFLFTEYPYRKARASLTEVTDFSTTSFALFPQNAIVIAGWSRFTVLLYHQKVNHLRQDLLIVELQKQRRYYEHLRIKSYEILIEEEIDRRPIIIDAVSPALQEKYRIQKKNENWFSLRRIE